LFAVASRPEVVSLAGGMPNLAALPMDALAGEVADLVAREGHVALQYGSAQGRPELREQICEVMALEGIRANPDDVVVTVGSQMALDLLTRIYCNPGDVVLAEGLSYVGALGSFAACQARVVHVATNAHGLVPSLLRAALETVRPRPKFLYTVPTFHNPAGVTHSVERRPRCSQCAGSTAWPSSRTTRTGSWASAGTPTPRCARSTATSSTWARSRRRSRPGCGWVGRSYHLPCATASCWRPNRRPSARRVSPRCWSRGTWPHTTGAARSRRTPRLTATAATPCCARWRPTSRPVARGTSPTAGFYVWLTVPEGVDTKAMLPRAVTARVAYASSTAFYADGLRSRQLRLSYCYPSPDRITEGVRRLAGVLAAELDVLHTFGSPARPAVGRGPQAPSPSTP
jgi:2-aminoadipate transaminase